MNIPANLQRRPFLAPIGLLALAAIAGVLVLITAAWLLVTSTSTTIILVRHAPQILGSSDDAPLSSEGEARAAALARMLGDTHLKSRIAAIYVTGDLRSRATAAPLAQSLGITPQVASQDDPRALAHRVLHEHRGDTVLVVGHANTLPALVSALSGASDIPPIEPSDHATLYIVTVPRIGRSEVLRLRY
jgi:broad specificity phosphatase PhoE